MVIIMRAVVMRWCFGGDVLLFFDTVLLIMIEKVVIVTELLNKVE